MLNMSVVRPRLAYTGLSPVVDVIKLYLEEIWKI